MKLRCEHNSLRLRLRKSELVTLQDQGSITERIDLGGALAFCYQLCHDPLQPDLVVSYEAGAIRITLPSALALAWITTAQVGIEARLPLPQGGQLDVLIEKDFPCVTRPTEDKSDFFADLANSEEAARC